MLMMMMSVDVTCQLCVWFWLHQLQILLDHLLNLKTP